MANSKRPILAVTDFSQRGNNAVHRAARLALAQAVELEILHVLQGLGSTPWWSETLEDDAQDALVRRSRALLDALATSVERDCGLQPSTALRRGSVASSVAAHASDIDASLLVVGATGASAVARRLLGSVAQAMLRQSPVPVLVSRIDSQIDYRRMLFATDFSPAADAAVETGLGLLPDAACFFFTALDVPGVRVEPLLGLDVATRAKRLHEARALTRERLGALAVGSGREAAGILVGDGRPSSEIPDHAREIEAEIICLGANAKPLMERIMLGSTSAHVVAEAGCDVLVAHVRPDRV